MKNTIVFALSSSVGLAEDICKELGLELGKCEVKHFADGEILVELGESVRGKHVYFVQSTNKPVNSNLMEILIGIDACKRASAASITAIIPYFGYARQDRKAKPRQPITSKLVASLLERAGADRVVTVDLHATQIQGFFDIPADDITANGLIADYFKHKEGLGEIVVVSPDHGGAVRARNLANALGAPIAIIDKRRPKPNVAVAMNLIGDVKDKICVMFDDIIDTAGTICEAAKLLKREGAKDVYVCAVHPVFSGPAIERLTNAPIKECIVTNTIPLDMDKMPAKIKQLSVAPLLGTAIARIHDDESVSSLFGFEKEMQVQ